MNVIKQFLSFLTNKKVYGLVIIIVSGLLVYKLIKVIISNVNEKGKSPLEIKKRQTVEALLQNVSKYLIVILCLMFILELYGVDTKSIAAGLGVIGLILGLGLQDILKDIFMGLTIIAENYYIIGDYVNYNNFLGKVIEFGLRTTKIKNFAGEVMIVPNRNINSIINLSQKKAKITIEIGLGYDVSSAEVEKTLNKVLKKMLEKPEVTEDSEYLGISDFKDTYVVYGIRIHCDQENQWQIKRETLQLIKEQFEQDKIKIRGI